MLHIFWMILKIIGMLAAVLFGLILVLILLLLFCPVRYRLLGSKDQTQEIREARAKARISWLFGGVQFRLNYENEAVHPEFCVLGIPLFPKNSKKKKPESSMKSRKKKAVKKEVDSGQGIDFVKGQDFQETDVSENFHPSMKNAASENELSSIEQIDSVNYGGSTEESKGKQDQGFAPNVDLKENTKSEKEENIKDPTSKGKESIFKKIRSFFQSMYQKIIALRSKRKKTSAKISSWKRFLTDQRTKDALKLLFRQGTGLLKHIFPRKLTGNITFGFSDPSLTGRTLAAAGMMYPWYQEGLCISALWEVDENIYYGTLSVSGRIYGIVVLTAAVKIFFSKNIRFIWKRLKHKEE